jgi:hypothetical protein
MTQQLKRRLLAAFKQSGCSYSITIKTNGPLDSIYIAKLRAYKARNKLLPVAFESAIEKKVADEDYGPCDFSFSTVPSLLRATFAMSVLGPTRVLDVLIRCEHQIGPSTSGQK